MDFNAGINSVNNYIYPSPTNLFNKIQHQPSNNEQSVDTFVISKDLIADLHHNKEKISVGTFLDGNINNKPASLKIVSNHQDESWLEGFINKKYLLLHTKDKNYKGQYGNSKFNLTVDFNKPSKFSIFINSKILGKAFIPDYFNIQGTIGNKQINLTLPNIKIPQDEDTKDLLTMVLEDNGLKAQTINGEIKLLKFAPSAIKDLKEKAEKREQLISNDIKPIIMQGLSTATGAIVGTAVTALMFKFGLKRG